MFTILGYVTPSSMVGITNVLEAALTLILSKGSGCIGTASRMVKVR
jgi:hypothetical protein